MYSDRRGMIKNYPGHKLPDERHPDKKTRRTIEREFVQGAFVRVFCTRLTKIRGWVRDVWHTFGGSRDVWQGGRRGSKLAKNSV